MPPVKHCTDGTNTARGSAAPCQTMYWWYKHYELPPVKQCTDGTNSVNCPLSNNILMVQTLWTAPSQTMYWWYKHCQLPPVKQYTDSVNIARGSTAPSIPLSSHIVSQHILFDIFKQEIKIHRIHRLTFIPSHKKALCNLSCEFWSFVSQLAVSCVSDCSNNLYT